MHIFIIDTSKYLLPFFLLLLLWCLFKIVLQHYIFIMLYIWNSELLGYLSATTDLSKVISLLKVQMFKIRFRLLAFRSAPYMLRRKRLRLYNVKELTPMLFIIFPWISSTALIQLSLNSQEKRYNQLNYRQEIY